MENSIELLSENQKWSLMHRLIDQRSAVAIDFPSQFRKVFFTRLLTENLLVFLLQYCGLMLTTFNGKPYPIWLATGTACAFLFMRSYTVVPGIWLGTFTAYYLTFTNVLVGSIWGTALTLQACVLFWIAQRSIYPTLLFYDKFSLFKFVSVSILITGLTSFALISCYYPFLNNFSFHLVIKWWLANLNGIFILSIALISLDAYFPEIHSRQKKLSPKFSILMGFCLGTILGFLILSTVKFDIFLGIITFPFIAAISFIYGRLAHSACMSLLLLLVILFINFNAHFSNVITNHIIYFQIILLLNALLGLFTCVAFKRQIY